MNNVTYLHTIYVNCQQRAIFDGSLQGLRTELAKLGIELSDLHESAMFGEDTSEEVADYLFDMHEYACYVMEDDLEGIDSSGIYLSVPEMKDEVSPVHSPSSYGSAF